jgi:hypothetical protein
MPYQAFFWLPYDVGGVWKRVRARSTLCSLAVAGVGVGSLI